MTTVARHWLAAALLGVTTGLLWGCASNGPLTKGKANTKGFRDYAPTRSAARGSHEPRKIAMVVGINRYVDRAWHGLRFAAKDALDMARVLRKSGRFASVLQVVTPKGTTRAGILAAFDRLKRLNADPRDTVLVYLSAHGTLARNPSGDLRRYIVTYDTRESNVPGTALSVDLLRARFQTFRSQRKVLILATCHSGSGKSRLTRRMTAELRRTKGAFFVKPLEMVSRATVVLGVCDFGETAQESPALKNDIYTHYFIQALSRKYDANGDGAVTVSEAHDYAKDLTYYHTRGKQRPHAESDILGTDPIVLTGKKTRAGNPVLYSYARRFQGVEVRVDGIPKGALPKGVSVEPGEHRVTLMGTDGKTVLFDSEVKLEAGERVDVRTLLQRRVFRFSVAPKIGYQGFFEGSSQDAISRSLPIVGLDLHLRRLFPIPLEVRFEIAFARGSHRLAEQDNRAQTVTEVMGGLSLPYVFTWRRLRLYAGVRLSVIHLTRRSDLHTEISDYFYSFAPGLLAGVGLRISSRWSVEAEGRVNYTYVTLEDAPARHQGWYTLMGGVRYRF